MFTNKEDFYKVSLFLFIGMIASLVICEIYPNGTDFRPAYLSGNNIFLLMVKSLYRVDTPTNVFPSIHAYNSLCMHIALMKSRELRKVRESRAPVFLFPLYLYLYCHTGLEAAFRPRCRWSNPSLFYYLRLCLRLSQLYAWRVLGEDSEKELKGKKEE